ncbi:MAG: hypothetical protein KF824_02840 [Fimbriimonadaceae bacterium]|nr:MAG: hypothetical protein KF824_02840 [Fimbriimonadaceae bacterium]
MISFALGLMMTQPNIAPSVDDSWVTEGIESIWPSEEEEKWMRVGWRLDLFAARAEAQEKGKPIFMWMMNGHPTGCT